MSGTDATLIPGYAYGNASLRPSPVTVAELELLKLTVGWTPDDEVALRLAGHVLEGQTKKIVDHWRRQIIGNIPHLARHSKTPDGMPLPEYSQRSGARFEQWILDTCLRQYDQDWLNYQNEIALRHMVPGKNKTDGVQSTPFVPLRDIVAFIPVMNETIRSYLAAKGHRAIEVERMHVAWCKSVQLQVALWLRPYSDSGVLRSQW